MNENEPIAAPDQRKRLIVTIAIVLAVFEPRPDEEECCR